MNTFSAGLRRGPISPSTLALLVLGALLTIMAASPQDAFGAGYVVDTTLDTNLTACTGAAGDCSLRGAITNANANGGGDTITFDATAFTNTAVSPDTGGDVGQHSSVAIDAFGNAVVSYRDNTNLDLKVLHCGNADCTTGNSIATPDSTGDVGQFTSLALDSSGFPVVSYLDVTNTTLKVLHCGNANCTSGNSIKSPDVAGVGHYTSLVLDGSGFPVISYQDIGGVDLRVMHCNDANCAPAVNGAESVNSPDTTGLVGYYTSLVLDASGFPVVSEYDFTNSDLKVVHCDDANCAGNNESITSPDTTGTVGEHTSLALDASGYPVVSYLYATTQDLKVLHCGNANCTSGNTVTSPDTGTVGSYTSLSLDASGLPVVSYKDPANDDLKVLHCGNASCTSGNSIASPDTAANVGSYTSLALDASGNPVVSYWDNTNQDLKVLHCGNSNCASANSTASPDTVGDVGHETSLALDASGFPVVSYRDVTNADLKVMHCGNVNCTSGNTITSPDTAGDVGWYPSLVLDASGFPVVSYRDVTNADLKVLHCGNANCTSGNTVTSPDTAGSVGLDSSLALDAAGFPVISYRDVTNGDLKVLHCGNANCTSDNSTSSPDTVGIVGYETSLALDASGFPVVSYWDNTNEDLRVLHCGNANCTSGNVITSPDTIGSVGWNPSLALDASGYPVVSYHDGTNGDLKLLHCGDANCASGNSTSSPDTAGVVGYDTAMALDAAGFPVVSYLKVTNSDLKVLHCGNLNCAAGIPATITLGSALPAMTAGGDTISGVGAMMTVNGATGGFNCFTISGEASDGNTINGLQIRGCGGRGIRIEGGADGNTVGGTTTGERNVISGNSYGIHITGSSTSANVVEGNYIGTNPAGTAADSQTYGVYLDLGASGNFIGGMGPDGRNLISGNAGGGGVAFEHSGTDGNVVRANYIGTNASGTAPIANGFGIAIAFGPSGNTIGGAAAADRNVISGNTNEGVSMSGGGDGTDANLVKGNYIGTNAAGTAALANGTDGVLIEIGAGSNTIGGSTAGERNVISGNTSDGISISGTGTTGNVVRGNYIGTNAAGTAAIANFNGVLMGVGASANTVGGSTAGERNVLSGNTRFGVAMTGLSNTGNVVKGNYIGTDAAGTSDLGNGWDGARISASATGNTIGGTTTADRNVISGNDRYGVSIDIAGSNAIAGNYIGLNASGTAALANTLSGVVITGASTANTIGGTTAGARNVISGNSQSGVYVDGNTADANVIKGNYIGTDYTGTLDRGNGDSGVTVLNADDTIIGGSAAGEGNVISGNTVRGVAVMGTTTTGTVIRGNFVGTTADGTAAIANSSGGIVVQDSGTSVTIGGTAVGAGNLISGNGGGGIGLTNSASGSTVQGNKIGTNATATAGVPNTGDGIQIHSGSNNNVIGGTGAGAGNIVAFNADNGVCLVEAGAAATGNDIRGNSIYSNSGRGIDLSPVPTADCTMESVTANDAGDLDSGPNNLINFPVITSASYNAITRTLTVSGTLDTVSPLTTTVDVYGTDVPDGSGYGEGHEWLGGASPNGAGVWNLISSPVTMPPYGYLSATTTDVSANTSEFSLTFDADLDGDGFASSTDDCDTTYNPLQMDHDADGIGDVCDSVVRNRYSASSSSVIAEYATAPGQQLHDDGRFYDPWDYNAGSGIDTGALVGTLDVTVHLGGISAPCDQGNLYNVNLINATTSMTTLVNTSSILADGDSDGLVNGVEQFPRFLTTLLDPERHSNVDDDGDGAIDEDAADGVDNDSDTKIDEDPAGMPTALHARYFGQIGGGFIQVLIIEEVPNTLYRRLVIFNDPIGPFFVGTDVCSPLEYRQTVNNNSANNPTTTATEGVAAVLGSVSAGTHVFRYERIDPPDTDGDGVVNYLDDCVLVANDTQVDGDSDRIGDACDPTPAVNTGAGDHDGDGYYNVVDNCPTIANASQLESERRTASPFGQYAVGDAIGDACDSDPTLVLNPAEISISRYSDAICVTGGGVTDADADGWCGGTATEDPDDSFATGAPVTPESATVSIGSCTNGVDDDGDASTDFADSGCADSDGDAVPDAVDICDAAADPLQIDGDGDAQGDACEDDQIATLSLTATTNAAASELRGRLVEVAPKPLHRPDGIINFIDADWGVTAGGSVADGAIRAAYSISVTAGIDPSPGSPSTAWKPCNNVVPLNFTLIDASLNPADTITPGTGFDSLVADTDVDGIPNGAEQYPSFLTALRDASTRVDNDADNGRDEDPVDGFDNDQDGAVDEDPYDPATPIVRMFGSTRFQGATRVVNILVFSPGSLFYFPASRGYPALVIFDDPTANTASGNVTDVCSHQDMRLFQYGVSLDNPGTAANEGGTKIMSNDSMGAAVPPHFGTEQFFTQVTTQPDLDGDGIENSLDVCVTDADNDEDGTADNLDATPWNPRLVSPPGDPDNDGYPNKCDPDDFVPSPPGSGPDQDGDHIENAADNCPAIANADQTDGDRDGMGNVCDPAPFVTGGGNQQYVNGTPLCTGGTDADRDGYCLGLDPNDTSGVGNPLVPEVSAYDPAVCNDDEDNDVDTLIDLADTAGCEDVDVDGVLNAMDNCPGVPPDPPFNVGYNSLASANPGQEDSDRDGSIGSQPYARSAADPEVEEGDPPTVLGEPYARSDHFGGDACDPDDDNDGLPDGNEPNVFCPANPGPNEVSKHASKDLGGDCDNDLLLDLWEYNGSGCLSITVANSATANADGDSLFNYGEGVIGTDPCNPNSGPDFSDDITGDGDGYKAAHERYIIALASTYVPQAYNDRCGAGADPSASIAWPSDLVSGGIPNSTDKLNVLDLTSFIAPAALRRLDTKLAPPTWPPTLTNYNRRWDLQPGPGVFANWINVTDITALIAGSTGFPPMFGGSTKAFNGPTCTP